MKIDITAAVGLLVTAFALIAAIWRGVIKPNLIEEFVTKKDCVVIQAKGGNEDNKRDAKLESLEKKVEAIGSEVKVVGINVEWIKGALERLERLN